MKIKRLGQIQPIRESVFVRNQIPEKYSGWKTADASDYGGKKGDSVKCGDLILIEKQKPKKKIFK